MLPLAWARRWIRQFAAVSQCRMVFTGGEPFLYFPLLRTFVHEAASAGFSPSVWTNGYWITGPDEFRTSLRYLSEVGLKELIVSDDEFHGPAVFSAFRDRLLELAGNLGVVLHFAIIYPKDPVHPPDFLYADPHVLHGPVMHRGRAADTCTAGQARWQVADFDSCPFVSFDAPHSLYVDANGFLHICPGFPLADLKTMSIKRFLKEFDWHIDPVAHAIAVGGPAQLARELSIPPSTGFVDYCHACWELRRKWAARRSAGA